jgi:membrane-associated PAP2 superfamily phosphatase
MVNGELSMMNGDYFDSPFSTFTIRRLLTFPVHRVTAAAAAKLLELQPVRRVLFVLCRHVIALFALSALQNNVISRHRTSSFVRRPWSLANDKGPGTND